MTGLIIGLFGSGLEVFERGEGGPTGMVFIGRAVNLVFEFEDEVVVAEIVVGILGRAMVGIGRGIAEFIFISCARIDKSICNILACDY